MKHNYLLYAALGVIVILYILHYIAGIFYLYWTVWWFDYLTHFLAGLGGGLAALSLLKNYSGWRAVVVVVSLLLFVGGVWEIFEYANDLTSSVESYPMDVAMDLVMDTSGAITAGLIVVRSRLRS